MDQPPLFTFKFKYLGRRSQRVAAYVSAIPTRTAQSQSNQPEDRQLLASIRSKIVEDRSLSMMAHNVKVIVERGAVTLRGPVKSAEEKAQIETLAKQVQGVTKVNNRLDVKSKPSAN